MRIFAALFSRSALLALLAIVATACTVVVEEDRPRPGPRPGPDFCTRQYEPVCARRDGDRRTFPNACEADQAGYRILRDGECRREGGGGFDEERFCTREYRPVCASRRGNIRTFPNECEARAANHRIIGDGPC